MSKSTVAKDSIARAIKNENFTPSEVISEYPLSGIAKIIVEMIDEKRSTQDVDNKVDLSETELQNLYLLAKTIISKNMIEQRERSILETRSSRTQNTSLIPRTVLDSMYQLRPAH